MAPRIEEETQQYDSVIEKNQLNSSASSSSNAAAQKAEKDIELKIVWRNVALFIVLHLASLYGLYLCFYCKRQTLVFGKNYRKISKTIW